MIPLYQFDLWIGPASDNKASVASYPVRVYSDAGFARGQLDLAVNEEEFQSSLTRVCSREKNIQLRKDFGGRLFESLFNCEIDDIWKKSWADAGSKSLRVRLIVEPPEVASLPWELLWDGNSFLATHNSLAISRFLPVAEPPAPAPQDALRVLLITASPDGAPKITEQEVKDTEDTIRGNGRELDVVRDATINKVQEAIRRKQYQVIHFLGHGKSGALLLLDKDEVQPLPVDDVSFAQNFLGRRSLRLVVLSACNSAQSEDGLFSGMAPALVRAGMPAVISNQYQYVQLDTAKAFNRAFYDELAQGTPVDLAVNRARNSLSGLPDGQAFRDWSTPILYMGTRNGEILTLQQQKTRQLDEAWRVVQEQTGNSEAQEALKELTDRLKEISDLIHRLFNLVSLSDVVRTLRGSFDQGIKIVNGQQFFHAENQQLRQVWWRVENDIKRLRTQDGTMDDPEIKQDIEAFLAGAKKMSELLGRLNFGDTLRAFRDMDGSLDSIRFKVEKGVDSVINELRLKNELILDRLR